MQSLHLLFADLDTDGRAVLLQRGLHGETRLGRGMANEIDDDLMTDQGPSPPMLGNMRKHPMLDRLPLPGPWRKVPHRDRDTHLIGQLLQVHLPQPMAAGLAPPAIGGEGESAGGGGHRPRPPSPPPAASRARACGGAVVPSPP